MDIEDKLLNAMDSVHGGAIFTLADFTFAVAANFGGNSTVTQSASISYIRAGKGKILYAEAKKVNETKSTCVYKIEITEVKGQPVGLEPVQFKAGSRVTVGGKVVGTDGSTVEGFKGIVHHSVYDGETLVVCNGNDSGVEELFEYWDYSRKVFMGSDSVRGGKFSLTFPVPLDISYSQESGKIYFYAYDTNRTEAQLTA